jgi:serine/threonine-protein kinase
MPGLDDFIACVAKSGLIPAADLAQARARLPAGHGTDAAAAVRFARLLVKQGALTPYQARKVLAGATRGFVLGGYRLVRQLGEGGMGKIYLAAREGEDQLVAVKVLPRSRVPETDVALERFRRQIELSKRIRHPNIARIHEVGREDDIAFMVMEYVPGQSLYEAVKGSHGGPLDVDDAARFFLKVLDGLEAAHDAGLVHRDIKPSNLMLTPEGDARILDLGLAQLIGDEGLLSGSGLHVVVGTLDYASPEQIEDASQADRRSDLYSLGCTLYFALAGRPPFEGGGVINKIFKQKMEEPEPLERAARGVPAAFATLVRKLMAKDPDDRYRTCAELRADLRPWADPQTVRDALRSESGLVVNPPDDPGVRPSPEVDAGTSNHPPPPRRAIPRWLIRSLVFAILLGLLTLLVFTLRT